MFKNLILFEQFFSFFRKWSWFHDHFWKSRKLRKKSDHIFARGWGEADLGYQSAADMVASAIHRVSQGKYQLSANPKS